MDIIRLIKGLVSELMDVIEEFLEHLGRFSTFEETVNGQVDQTATDFIEPTLTAAHTMFCESGKL